MTTGLARFDEKYIEEPTSGCWLWTAGSNRHGYGLFWNGERMEQAHRVALRLSGVPVPAGADVCHRCDNPLCVNPAHLYVGDALTNIGDALRRGRHKHVASFGETNPSAKLTQKQVAEIRRLLARGNTHRAIAEVFGVSRSTVTLISAGKKWRRGNGREARLTAHDNRHTKTG